MNHDDEKHLHIHIHLDSVGEILKQLLSPLNTLGAKIMATLDDVKAALAAAAEAATNEKAEVGTKLDNLNVQIQALKDQIAGGTLVTAADLDALVTQINGIATDVENITTPDPVA